jgi:hypothetical protein
MSYDGKATVPVGHPVPSTVQNPMAFLVGAPYLLTERAGGGGGVAVARGGGVAVARGGGVAAAGGELVAVGEVAGVGSSGVALSAGGILPVAVATTVTNVGVGVAEPPSAALAIPLPLATTVATDAMTTVVSATGISWRGD